MEVIGLPLIEEIVAPFLPFFFFVSYLCKTRIKVLAYETNDD